MSLNSIISWVACWFRTRQASATAAARVAHEITIHKQQLVQYEDRISVLATENSQSGRQILEYQKRIRNLEGENEVLRAQLEMYSAWEARERARLEAEAAMQARVKVRSLEQPYQDDLL